MLTLYFDCISKNVKTKIFHYKNETRYISIKKTCWLIFAQTHNPDANCPSSKLLLTLQTTLATEL